MRTKYPSKSVTTQTIGNIGLYYACYILSLFGWNVLPTSRNTKGIDILLYSQDATRSLTIQVKTLSKKGTVLLGNINDMMAQYYIIVVRNPVKPYCYIFTQENIRHFAVPQKKDNNKYSFPINNELDCYLENWKIIGNGVKRLKNEFT